MSSEKQAKTPRQVIERIRTHSFLLDLDSESEMVKEGALNLQEQLNNALRLLSHDLYDKKSHFVLELVQNADDNHYKVGVTPHLTFQVTPKCLVVKNNEVGFSEANIKAICSVGASSKSKEKTGYIGEKGIGFKSVFIVSNAPEIHSNGFHFRFDRTDERNLLGYVVPYWCEPAKEVMPDCTTIILPAAPTYEFGPETLVDLDARLLLFLNKLRQLTLEHDGRRVTYRRKDKAGVSHLTAERESDAGERVFEEMRYVRASMSFPMMDQFADEKRPGIERSTVVLAFPVDTTGAAKPDPYSYVFAFLPVKQMGFKFQIQADFILGTSRGEVLTDRPWNQLLRAGIPVVFSTAIEEFKKTDALGFTYLKYVPAEGEVADPFFRSIRKAIIDKLATTTCLRAASGGWELPSKLRLAGKDFRKLFSSSTALELFGFDYVDQRVQGGSELLRSIGAKDVLLKDVLTVFSDHSDWLQAQPIDWKADFYAYVANQQEALLETGLLNCPCLPTSAGTMVVPAQENVFFPLSRSKRYGFEAELVFIDNDLYEEALKRSERVAELFKALNVSPDKPYDLVNSHILPRHSGEAWKSSDFKALIGHLRYVKDKITDYIDSATRHGKTEAQAFQALRDGIWVGSKRNDDGTWYFARVGELYLSKEYKPNFCVESLLSAAVEADKFVSPGYLSSKPKDAEADLESWRHFFARLGVRLSPAVEADGADWKCAKEFQLLLDSSNSTVRKATLECVSTYWSLYSARMSYNPTGRSTYVPKDTKVALSLRATLAPTKKRTTVPLAQSYYPTAEIKTLLGDGLPYIEATLSELMLNACHVTHKLDANALIKRLKQLKSEASGTAKQFQGIYRALDERFWDTESTSIKQSFQAEGLIHVKGAHRGWFKPSEVSWKSNGTFMDSLYPPLQSHYRDFNRFFLDRLGIPRELPTAKWVQALTGLESIGALDERRAEALAIYRRANRDLMPRFGRDDVSPPSWINTFEAEAVFINQRGEMVANDEYLFANDVPEIAALFEDDVDISFLALPPFEVPRLSRLLDAAEVSYLSDFITLDIVDSESGVVSHDLTARIQQSVLSIARVLYSKRPESFELALSEGRFTVLREIEVVEVPQVNLAVSLGEYRRETTADIALGDGRVLYRTGSKSVKDRIAAEICKFLGASLDLADTFTRILMENDPDSIEDFLKVRNIGGLPPDLLAALNSSTGSIAEEDGGDEAESVTDPSADSGQEPAQEPEPTCADGVIQPAANQNMISKGSVAISAEQDAGSQMVHSLRGGASPSRAGASPKAIEPPTAPKAPSHVPRSASSSGSDVPRAPAVLEGDPMPVGGNTTGPAVPSTGEANYVSSEGSLTLEGERSGDSPGGVPPPQVTSGRSTTDSGGLTSSFTQKKGSFGASHPKQGRSQMRRTKFGRLLSYATGPGDLDRVNPDDDPARAAAREATGRAAVKHFLATQAARWKSVTEMPHNNPGFDVYAITDDDQDEYIEIKGQSGAWTEEGVALTPTELMTAQQKGHRYWLCVVEYAQDDNRRQLHLLRNPYGLTQQFRFDVGWKSIAESVETAPLKPEKDMYIDMHEVGRGQILSVRGKGQFFNLHVILENGRQVNKLFNPAKMILSKEPTWQE